MPVPLTPGRRAALIAGVPLILSAITWNTVSLASFAARTTRTDTTVFELTGGHLSIEADDGSVTLTPSADGKVHVLTTKHFGLREPAMTERVDAAGLHLASNCVWYDSVCRLDVDISLPPDAAVDVDASGGSVTASGLSGAARLSSSGGSLHVSHMSGDLTLSSSGGSVSGAGLTSASVTADSSGGSVDIGFAAPPSHVDLDSSGGSTSVELPAGVSYAIDASASGGDTSVDPALRNDTGSPRTVKVRSSGGSAAVRSEAG